MGPVKVRLSPSDWITIALSCWILVLTTVTWQRVERPLSVSIFFLSLLAGIFLLAWLDAFMQEFAKPEHCSLGICRRMRPLSARLVTLVHDLYPIPLFYYVFIFSLLTTKVLFRTWLDPFFIRLDYLLFGYLPTLEWAKLPQPGWLKEVLFFSYFSYYPLIFGLPVFLLFKSRQAMREMVFGVSLGFYLCYFIYSWLPVMGGRIFPEVMQQTVAVEGGVFSRIMALVYINTPHNGGAFPSAHVCVAVVLAWLSFLYNKWLGGVVCLITLLMTISTVYCHYHWFVDALGGLLLGIVVSLFTNKIYYALAEKDYA